MVRGRQQLKRKAAEVRRAEAREQEDQAHRSAEELDALDRRLIQRWGGDAAALDRLGALSRDLEKLHREETKLLQQRDELVLWLHHRGQTWAMLSARTRLSRQALMKRMSNR
ncbi:hypothetical protein LK09_17640 [Microbacterium mangrovi]|uniref:Uncharacterized protein n=1 Tax=Microbacterium mangrovi TaxID=1348253 RepID=A0A0B2A2M6_9MICO|nr:hypothetical protein LK09_17640 [Microbacterium mangrovi]